MSVSFSLLASLCSVQDGCPKAPEATRQGTLSRQGIPSPSQFHIPETGLGLAQFGQVVTPHPVLCGQSRGILPTVMWPGRLYVERVLEETWGGQ